MGLQPETVLEAFPGMVHGKKALGGCVLLQVTEQQHRTLTLTADDDDGVEERKREETEEGEGSSSDLQSIRA